MNVEATHVARLRNRSAELQPLDVDATRATHLNLLVASMTLGGAERIVRDIADALAGRVGSGNLFVMGRTTAAYPERVFSALPIACSTRHSAQNIAFHELGRQAPAFEKTTKGDVSVGVAGHHRRPVLVAAGQGHALHAPVAHEDLVHWCRLGTTFNFGITEEQIT